MKLPPYLRDPSGYCYQATLELAAEKHLAPWYGRVGADGFAVPGTEPQKRWADKTVVCVASGPSLTAEDCAAVRELPVVVTNCSWRRAPFADVLYAQDIGWWQQHVHELGGLQAERWSASRAAAKEFEVNLFVTHSPIVNSGARAIEFAITEGAARVILLGYDCSLAKGTHWHGDHTRTMNPAQSDIERWLGEFQWVADLALETGVEVWNCSRDTALNCFVRKPLEELLTTEKSRSGPKLIVE